MDSNPASFRVNLFLFTCESKWMLQTKNSNLQKAETFVNTIKNDNAKNNNSDFGKKLNEISPPELLSKK